VAKEPELPSHGAELHHVETWTGERDGVFKTADLDFVGPEFLTAHSIQLLGIEGVEGGEPVGSRHILVEGVLLSKPTNTPTISFITHY
jgi:hypothetical protein